MLEREIDRTHEVEVARLLEGRSCGLTVYTVASFDSYDLILVRDGRLWAIGEVKTRNAIYDKMFLSVRKYLSLTSIAIPCGLQAYYFWYVPSEKTLGYVDVLNLDLNQVGVKHSGRFDRGYRNDIEPLLLVENVEWINAETLPEKENGTL